MNDKLIIHTKVNEVVGGAISNMTMDVEQAGSILLSATISTGETTVGKLESGKVNIDDEGLIRAAVSAMAAELHIHGVESLMVDSVNSDLPKEMNCLDLLAVETA